MKDSNGIDAHRLNSLSHIHSIPDSLLFLCSWWMNTIRFGGKTVFQSNVIIFDYLVKMKQKLDRLCVKSIADAEVAATISMFIAAWRLNNLFWIPHAIRTLRTNKRHESLEIASIKSFEWRILIFFLRPRKWFHSIRACFRFNCMKLNTKWMVITRFVCRYQICYRRFGTSQRGYLSRINRCCINPKLVQNINDWLSEWDMLNMWAVTWKFVNTYFLMRTC